MLYSTVAVREYRFRQATRRVLSLLLAAACCWAVAGVARAAVIVDINAFTDATTTDGDNDDPSGVAVNVFFLAGTYDVEPIGPAQGGAYTAWHPWGGSIFNLGCDTSGANCSRGWAHWYRLQSSEFSRIRVEDGILYSTPEAALANSLSTQFTLAADGVVSFFVFDTGPSDNVGGVSLLVTRIAEPTTMLLLLAGLPLLARARRLPGARSRKGRAGTA